jgi:hypothetical protein
LKAKLGSSLSYFSFKSLVPGAFNVGFIGSTCTALPHGKAEAARAPTAAAGGPEYSTAAQSSSPWYRGWLSASFQLNVSTCYELRRRRRRRSRRRRRRRGRRKRMRKRRRRRRLQYVSDKDGSGWAEKWTSVSACRDTGAVTERR